MASTTIDNRLLDSLSDSALLHQAQAAEDHWHENPKRNQKFVAAIDTILARREQEREEEVN